MTTIETTATCKPFSDFPRGKYRVRITLDEVRVWDSIAGHYTNCHSLSRRSQKRIAAKAQAARYVIDHDSIGERHEFDSLDEAVEAIRLCGEDFAAFALRVNGNDDILDDHGTIVGVVIGGPAERSED